jgi:HK97 family phage portal protein
MPNFFDRLLTRAGPGRSTGSTVAPNVVSPSVVYHDSYTHRVGPGGGWGWGAGPRYFVGPTRPPDTKVELGLPGDFIEGQHSNGPNEDDLGFPHSTRWSGYPSGWEQPFYEPPGGWGGGMRPGDGWGPYGRFNGGSMLEGRVSTVFSCTDLISRTLSTMDLWVTQASRPVVPPAWTTNPEPEIYPSIVDAIKQIVNSALIRGESFLIPTARYANGLIARWVVLNPDMVYVEPEAGGTLAYYLGGRPADGGIEIPRGEILHIRYQSWPGLPNGVGPLEACWRNVLSADALERYGTQLAANGGIPSAILQSQVKLTKTQAEQLKYSWAEAAQSRGVLPAVLSGGLTYTPLNLKPSEIGLLDLRRFDEQRIASAFGVPLWLVGLPMQDGLTYSTVEGTFDYLWRATLRALAYNIGCAIAGWALPRGQYLHFNADALIKPPLLQRAQAYKLFIEAGVLTPEEVRVMENLAPTGAGDIETLAVVTAGGM